MGREREGLEKKRGTDQSRIKGKRELKRKRNRVTMIVIGLRRIMRICRRSRDTKDRCVEDPRVVMQGVGANGGADDERWRWFRRSGRIPGAWIWLEG